MAKETFLDLLKSHDMFVVPIIQRDYAQGRDEGVDKDLCEDVRTSIVDSLYQALVSGEELVLDYVYGSDDKKVFYPIDGQQRLTTLFLLHWYIGKKEGKTPSDPDFKELRKFAYETRDTSKEFCQALIDVDIDFSSNQGIDQQIKDSSKYHRVYDLDPTISAMLVMLKQIDDKFRNEQSSLWSKLSNIKFWVLSLQNFGLTDDLFIKMNARGKRLSRFDVFKSDLESKLSSHVATHGPLIDEWKKEIDNGYLDKYWAKFGADLAEKNLFRTILFFFKALSLSVSGSFKPEEGWDDWEENIAKAKYKDVLEYIDANIDSLGGVSNLLSNFGAWEGLVPKEFFIKPSGEEKIPFYKKALAFGILYWFCKEPNMKAGNVYFDEFIDYNRILKNYVYSLRQADYKPHRQYSSSLDNKSIARCLGLIKNLADGYAAKGHFYDYVRGTTFPELEEEREKLRSVYVGGTPLNSFIDLEELPYMGRNIHNVFFGGSIHLNKAELETIFRDDDLTNKSLRIILSFASSDYGKAKRLIFDPKAQQSGRKKLYYESATDEVFGFFHKYGFRDDGDFGDRVLTSKGSEQYQEMSKCVRSFVTGIETKLKARKSVAGAVNELLDERIAVADFSDPEDILWYIVKYPGFFWSPRRTSLSITTRKDYQTFHDTENVYDIQCLNDEDNNFDDVHYHPFYMALSALLTGKITIDPASLRYTGVKIEYEHPCTLSNGWTIRITSNGNWSIDFKGHPPITLVKGITLKTDPSTGVVSGVVDCSGADSIQTMAGVLNSI